MKKELENELTSCLRVVNRGGVLLYPTDTIWGLGCDATNETAIERIFEIKGREHSKSILILCYDIQQVENYVETIPEQARILVKTFEKPLTIIYPKAQNLPASLLASDGSIGIRIPRHEFCLALLEKMGKPLVSTSANISGELSPKSFNEISPKILQQIDYAVEMERNKISEQASIILKINETGEIITIRP